MQLNIICAAFAQNASLDKCYIMLSDTRCAVSARLIIFACQAFQADNVG